MVHSAHTVIWPVRVLLGCRIYLIFKNKFKKSTASNQGLQFTPQKWLIRPMFLEFEQTVSVA